MPHLQQGANSWQLKGCAIWLLLLQLTFDIYEESVEVVVVRHFTLDPPTLSLDKKGAGERSQAFVYSNVPRTRTSWPCS
jgi:hypothetical protein